MPVYDPREVPLHFSPATGSNPVLLVAEAPGSQEAATGLPLLGPQGANLYRGLIAGGVSWAKQWSDTHPSFRYPVKASENDYKKKVKANVALRIKDRKDWLVLRSKHVACTNSYPLWPKSSSSATDFVNPLDTDVCSTDNLARLRRDAVRVRAKVLLMCGEFACLACTGQRPNQLQFVEGQDVTAQVKLVVMRRLGWSFAHIWYLAHPRRWRFDNANIDALKAVATQVKW